MDHSWTILVMPEKRYIKEEGTNSVAITYSDIRQIKFIAEKFDRTTIIHELCHAYASQLNLVELDLDDDQVEEFFCEMFGKYGEQIIAKAEEITLKY